MILGACCDWVTSPPKNIVVVSYVRPVRAEQFNLAGADIGKLAVLLVDAATIVIGTPTVLSGAHPQVAYAAYLANVTRPKARYLSVIGSFGWGGNMVEQLSAMMPNLKVEVISPVLCKGVPKAADLEALDKLADVIPARRATL